MDMTENAARYFGMAKVLLCAVFVIVCASAPSWAGPNEKAGCSIDADATTFDYDDAVSRTDIETAVFAEAGQNFYLLVAAQNVVNLDTFNILVDFDQDILEFVGGETSSLDIENIMEKENAFAVCMKPTVLESSPGTVAFACSLQRGQEGKAPDGSGVAAILEFRLKECGRCTKVAPVDVSFCDVEGFPACDSPAILRPAFVNFGTVRAVEKEDDLARCSTSERCFVGIAAATEALGECGELLFDPGRFEGPLVIKGDVTVVVEDGETVIF